MDIVKNYDAYNREERALCAHLFRLLHVGLAEDPHKNALADFIRLIAGKNVAIDTAGLRDGSLIDCTNASIYFEVSLIQDYYKSRAGGGKARTQEQRRNGRAFTEQLLDSIDVGWRTIYGAQQHNVEVDKLLDPQLTHPQQIQIKANTLIPDLKVQNDRIFGELKSYFPATPDIAIAFGGKQTEYLMLIEAKFTEPPDVDQDSGAKRILSIWAQLLWRELGFRSQPVIIFATLGKSAPPFTISWAEVEPICVRHIPAETDRTRIAFRKAMELLGH